MARTCSTTLPLPASTPRGCASVVVYPDPALASANRWGYPSNDDWWRRRLDSSRYLPALGWWRALWANHQVMVPNSGPLRDSHIATALLSWTLGLYGPRLEKRKRQNELKKPAGKKPVWPPSDPAQWARLSEPAPPKWRRARR
jgi:hypothetical protein